MAALRQGGGTTFFFQALLPGGGVGAPIHFRGTITNIQVNHSPSWGEHMDMGRADPKFMYNQYQSNISVDWYTIAAQSGEHKTWIQAINSLSEMTKPVYKSGAGFNGVYCFMSLGDIIGEHGLISNFSYSIDNETPWIDNVPLYINCSLDFRVIQAKKPNYQSSKSHLVGGFGSGISD